MKNYIGISRDHSLSMVHLTNAAMRDYNENIKAIKEAAAANEIDTICSVVKCGTGRPARVDREIVNSNVNVLKPMTSYVADGTATPLFDSVMELIRLLEAVPDAHDPQVAFVVMVITDGEENASRTRGEDLARKIKELQQTDKWTFAFRVPKGYARNLSRYGIPAGNILEWEQTEKGYEAAMVATTAAVTEFYSARKSGVRSTTSFYANLKDVSITDVKKVLKEITSDVMIFTNNNVGKTRIDDFINSHGVNYVKGCGFYELIKAEKAVQDYKKIALRDRATGRVYGGDDARHMLGLPTYGTVSLSPGDHNGFDIFIQSTSMNRIIPQGSKVLYWKNAF